MFSPVEIILGVGVGLSMALASRGVKKRYMVLFLLFILMAATLFAEEKWADVRDAEPKIVAKREVENKIEEALVSTDRALSTKGAFFIYDHKEEGIFFQGAFKEGEVLYWDEITKERYKEIAQDFANSENLFEGL